MNSSRILNWRDIDEAIATIARLYKGRLEGAHGIIGISRGGLVPAVMLAHAMNIGNVVSLNLQMYPAKGQEEPLICLSSPIADEILRERGEGWLLVDDLMNTGRTLRYAARLLPKATLVALFCRVSCAERPPHVVYQYVEGDSMLLFPWEYCVPPSNSCGMNV